MCDMFHIKGKTGRFRVFDQCGADVIDFIYDLQARRLRSYEELTSARTPFEIYDILNSDFKVNIEFTVHHLINPLVVSKLAVLWRSSRFKRASRLSQLEDKSDDRAIVVHCGSALRMYGINANWLHYVVSYKDGGDTRVYDGFQKIFTSYTNGRPWENWTEDRLARLSGVKVEVGTQS